MCRNICEWLNTCVVAEVQTVTSQNMDRYRHDKMRCAIQTVPGTYTAPLW